VDPRCRHQRRAHHGVRASRIQSARSTRRGARRRRWPRARASPPPAEPPRPAQPPLILKDPAEARQEGADAAVAGKRIYDNPYPAGDPCRAAWDEGWCGQKKSHGMETPQAYQRRTETPDKKGKDGEGQGQGGEGDPGNGAGDGAERGAA